MRKVRLIANFDYNNNPMSLRFLDPGPLVSWELFVENKLEQRFRPHEQALAIETATRKATEFGLIFTIDPEELEAANDESSSDFCVGQSNE